MGWVCALASVLLVSVAQLLMKWAMIQLPAVEQLSVFVPVLFSFSFPVLILLTGLLCYAGSMLCWLFALQRIPLSRAYPLLSVSYLFVWGAALFIPVFDEPFLWGKVLGGGMILTGLLLIFWPDKKNR